MSVEDTTVSEKANEPLDVDVFDRSRIEDAVVPAPGAVDIDGERRIQQSVYGQYVRKLLVWRTTISFSHKLARFVQRVSCDKALQLRNLSCVENGGRHYW
jgi:hypothetical protein